ncbi:myelin regulatory factor-like [Physella acuta]|uniref:myelin regulatory factor-like n=1 Tax=Physella acuta TaxID=109671 RepID=UPI0027DBE175|nr:myelin regulatory factor-like [Physella acuta]
MPCCYLVPHYISRSLPDSPPDSGSEPYSPPDGTLHHQALADLKSTIPGSLPTLPQSMYLGHNRLGGMPTKAPPAYIGESQKLNHLLQGQHQQGQRLPMQYPSGLSMGQQMTSLQQISPPLSHPILPTHMGSLSNIASQSTKKRKYSESPTGTLNPNMMHGMGNVMSIKQEPPGAQFSSYMGDCPGGDDDLPQYDVDSNDAFIESTYQVIKWQPYSQAQWVILTDGDLKDLPTPQYRVDADKGFNFSVPDEAFVCQKKNHFQVTVHMRLHGNAKYIRTIDGVKKIESFFLHFYGVKMESQNQSIKIEQSQSDRSKKSFHPVKVDLTADQETKVTVGRLHFSETTSNNMRKKGKPNPDQRYFLLVVSLHAHTGDKDYMLVGNVSDRIIVRASNPGQFDSDVDVMWQKGQTQESVFHMGRVGVNTDHPDENLTVHGNMRLTGHLTQPSDMRVKKNVQEINPKSQLENVSKLRIYKYSYKDEYASQVGIPRDNHVETGVLAQEIKEVIPDAVQETGDVVLSNGETIENFLVVNKDRIFMENVGAVKELCKLTDNLEVRINQLEKMNQRLGKLKRFDSLKSTGSTLSSRSNISTISSTPSLHQESGHRSSSSKRHHHEHHSSSSSHSSHHMMGSSKSSLASLFSQPLKNICSNRFRYITIICLVFIMIFCVVALAWLYILERQKPDSSSVVANLPNIDSSSTPSLMGANSTTINTPTEVVQEMSTISTSTQSTTLRTTPVMISSTTSRMTQPVVPPYPSCIEGYCEKLCCPSPHEDQPDTTDPPQVIIHGNGGYENPPYILTGDQSGEMVQQPTGDEEESSVNQYISTAIPHVATIFNLPGKSETISDNVVEGSPKYNVITHLGGNGKYRRRRGADDAPRPTIRIVELDYVIDDVFCLVNGCRTNNYSYYVPLNESFGYDEIKLELSTPTMSYIALCSSRFLWSCPPPAQQTNEVVGQLVQQTHQAFWSVRIGNHYKTYLNFRVIHSLLGHSVSPDQACQLQSSSDFVVMNYTIQFQRQC